MADKQDRSVRIDKWDIGNPHQKADAVSSVYYQIVRPEYGFQDRFSLFVFSLMNVPLCYAEYDRRWRETKDYEKARENLMHALREFDDAHAALSERIKTFRGKR